MVQRLEVRAGLVRALANDEFVVHYQPIVDLTSGGLVGVEALVRWQHPENGLVAPNDFIPVAEETGLIVDVGRWVLNRALEQVCQWNRSRGDAPPLRLSVNVSPRQLYGSDFLATVEEALAVHHLPTELLTLELTEGVLLRNDAHVSATLTRLRARGIRLAIDDFGTGYSALGYLRDFPVTTLKIDRSFVTGLPGDGQHAALVDAIIRMSESLDLQVIAEGIEDTQHQDAVARLGCRFGQGFLYAEPLSARAFEQTLLETETPGSGRWPAAAPVHRVPGGRF
jgi:EAL domain-containing protein (putative c-di-GMP-specific phosphodiesterase class I)